jgi:hypothetical protein
MSTAAKPKSIRQTLSHCNQCGDETKHFVVGSAERRRSSDEDRYSVEWGTTWELLQCCGCEQASMTQVNWCSEDDPYEGREKVFFPPRVSRQKPAWLTQHPELNDYIDLFEEVYTALQADSRRLAMMGARAVIDLAVARMLGSDPGNFTAGMNELVAAKRLSDEERALIDAAFDAGSAAMHRGHQPEVDDVNTAIDIVERVVHAEVLKKKAKALADATPKRPQRKPKTNDKKDKNAK